MSAGEFAPAQDLGKPASPSTYQQLIGPRVLGTSAARAFLSTLPRVFDDERVRRSVGG
ncbi:hypothetical protein [Nocardia sp. NPDC060255]|uniref:hypothetical protein n=1 Tax=Nocardia sp. NPDC060255 TaxID=3347085 RepID=UPI00366211A5